MCVCVCLCINVYLYVLFREHKFIKYQTPVYIVFILSQ